LGIEVVVFRGNNRNRRRGFHNCYIVRKRLEALKSPPDPAPAPDPRGPNMSYNRPRRTQHIEARRAR
jgi:hypothetical protein